MQAIQLKRYCFIITLFFGSQTPVASKKKNKIDLYHEDGELDSCGLATKYGHPCTKYNVITEDNYILTLFRLKKKKTGNKRKPILLVHGFQSSSDNWLIRGKKSLAITLADKGYEDLWLCNLRGNKYSRRHLYLNPDTDNKFWNFSFHEHGYYDLPAIIDKVLNETNVKKLTAIAHSEGNTIFFVLGSTRSEYNSKVNVMIALSPICFFQNTKFPVSFAVALSPLLDKLAENLGLTEILGDNTIVRKILKVICPLPVIGYIICAYGILFPLGGYDAAELGPAFFRKTVPFFPAGSSWNTLSHFLQVGYRKKFARYNYGSEINHGVYNLSSPPDYDLRKVTMPVALIAGRNDHMSTFEDIALLRERLPNVVSYVVSPWHLFSHNDALWGRRIRTLAKTSSLLACNNLSFSSIDFISSKHRQSTESYAYKKCERIVNNV